MCLSDLKNKLKLLGTAVVKTHLMGNFLEAIKSSDMVQCVNGWGQATMKTEDLQYKVMINNNIAKTLKNDLL